MHYILFMEPAIKYRGKTIHADDVSFIKGQIAENPNDSRLALSVKLCKAWNWVQPNGALKDMVCRGLNVAAPQGRSDKAPRKESMHSVCANTLRAHRHPGIWLQRFERFWMRNNP